MTTLSGAIVLAVSMALFVGSIIWGTVDYLSEAKSDKTKLKNRILTPFQKALLGIFFATFVIFYPVYYYSIFPSEHGFFKVIRVVALSLQHSLQVFVINTYFSIVKEFVMTCDKAGGALKTAYSVYATVLYAVAPVMTLGFILSFFKETVSRVNYHLHTLSDIYIMSELNERSIVLATDIKEKIKGRKLIVFAGVQKKDEDGDAELIAQARHLGAICFKSDITDISLKRRSKKIKRKLYFISENEDDNISKALNIIGSSLKEKNLNSKNTEFYVFAAGVESEILLNSTDIGEMKVRRVNDNKNLVWNTLREHSIFADAISLSSQDKTLKSAKQLNIAIVGCGNYGIELIKAICWLGQLPRHKLNLHIFDKDKNVEDKMRFVAPELVKRSGIEEDGEASYTLHFHPDTDVTSASFINKLSEIGRVTTVFVTLGSDEMNIDTAVRMRIEFLRNGFAESSPSIYPVVYSSIRSEIAEDGSKFVISSKNTERSYNLKFVGAIDKRFSLQTIEQAELEEMAKVYHLSWANSNNTSELERMKMVEADTKKFEKYEYYRSSSIAQAIYNEYLVEKIKEMRANSGKDFGTEDIVLFNDYEHRRWNAYMRAEGYVYCKSRNDLAKMHHDLIPFDDLPYDDKEKDNVWRIALDLEERKKSK